MRYKDKNIDNNVRHVISKVEVSEGTSTTTFTHDGDLVSWEISRTSENNKFFGFGIFQKVNVKIRDIYKQYDTPAGAELRIYASCENNLQLIGIYKITETHRNENTNQLSITAYDLLYWATAHTMSEITTNTYENLTDWIRNIMRPLGIDGQLSFPSAYCPVGFAEGNLAFIEQPNIEGTETFREFLDDIAELTQTVYFVDIIANKPTLLFQHLNPGATDKTISSDLVYSLSTKTNRRLQKICATTALGDNVEASIDASGSTQYLRDNVFLSACDSELVAEILQKMIEYTGGYTFAQYDLEWHGDFHLYPGDMLRIATNRESSEWIKGFAANDTLTYDGTFSMKSEWKFQEDEAETANSATLGDRLKETYAFVDKANKQIQMVVSDMTDLDEKVTNMEMTTDSISASVSQVSNTISAVSQENKAEINKLKQENTEEIADIYDAMDVIAKSVDATITAEDLRIEVSKQLSDGVDKVTTSTGFTFNEEGLTVSKSASEISTTITEDGMKIYRNQEAVLTANNKGVDAYNLHATTYLIVGQHSRFEDYGERTGCFWISESQSSATTSEIMEINDELEVI